LISFVFRVEFWIFAEDGAHYFVHHAPRPINFQPELLIGFRCRPSWLLPDEPNCRETALDPKLIARQKALI
jgi:hypothetical protein